MKLIGQKRFWPLILILWWVIVEAALGIAGSSFRLFRAYSMPELTDVEIFRWSIPLVVYLSCNLLSYAIMLVAGVAILRRHKWGRILFFTLMFFMYCIKATLFGIPSIWGSFTYLLKHSIWCLFLLSPFASRYFKVVVNANDSRKMPPLLALVSCWVVAVELLMIFLLTFGLITHYPDNVFTVEVFGVWVPHIALQAYAILLNLMVLIATVSMLTRHNWGRIFLFALIPLSHISHEVLPLLFMRPLTLLASGVYMIILLTPSTSRYLAMKQISEDDSAEMKKPTAQSRKKRERIINTCVCVLLGAVVWSAINRIPENATLLPIAEAVAPGLVSASKLIDNLKSSDTDLLQETLSILTIREEPVALDHAIPLLQHADRFVWVPAALYVGSFNKVEAVPYLIKALRHGWKRSHEKCVAHLQSITGQAFENDFDQWKSWWENNHPDLEFDWNK